jgi:hypothetical protein
MTRQAARDVSRMLPTNAHGTRGAFRKRYRCYRSPVSHAYLASYVACLRGWKGRRAGEPS